MTLHVPFRVVKRGGRKEIQLPEGAPQHRRRDSALVKALGRAFRWKRMLENGEFATIGDLAGSESIAHSYMTRVLRLTLLAPDIVEVILDGKHGPELTLRRRPTIFEEGRQRPHGRAMPAGLVDARTTSNRRMTMNMDEGHRWVEREVLQQMARELGAHLVGCLLHLIADAEDNGEIAYQTAVMLLAAAPDMSKLKAHKDVSRLVKAGWLAEKGDQLAIKGYGTTFIQDRTQKPPA
ncbi:hypothetical protein [Paracoccus liaowanqingii]|uniref:hypothetical protein n=1 Tax=Paracoccus liaowanqingii TaxID=2560053 RepID=UPI002F3EA4F5